MCAALTNFISYLPSLGSQPRIGHLDFSINCITPLSFPSGTYLTSLSQVIGAGRDTHFIPSSRFESPIPLSSVTLLPPLPGRDVLAVGKNYSEHAKEFNSSGFDSSDKVDIPTHPVIFTKRASSIIASGEEIYHHQGWTETLDYEGEIGVILGKEGFRVGEDDAWDYVWGFTIINDITARDRQRDHKQFFLGKSADTFCPMGPIAVPLTSLPNHKSLRLITRVNNELRQDSDLTQLIFSIPTLIATISSALTIQPGDVIATGTPAGVGIGRKPPIFLKPGDTISISVSGLGTLTNTIAPASSSPPKIRHLPASSPEKKGLIRLATSGKLVHIERRGSLDSPIVAIFIHGLGGSTQVYHPIIDDLYASLKSEGTDGLEDKQLLLYDLEGHGFSPTTPESVVSMASYVEDLRDLVLTLGLERSLITFVAYSLGCTIAINYYAEFKDNPESKDNKWGSHIEEMILASLSSNPLPVGNATELHKRAEKVRAHGILSIVDSIAIAADPATDDELSDLMAIRYRRNILANTDSEGYAKGCTAWATAQVDPRVGTIRARISPDGIRVVTLDRGGDVISSHDGILRMSDRLDQGGHWSVLEDRGVLPEYIKFIV